MGYICTGTKIRLNQQEAKSNRQTSVSHSSSESSSSETETVSKFVERSIGRNSRLQCHSADIVHQDPSKNSWSEVESVAFKDPCLNHEEGKSMLISDDRCVRELSTYTNSSPPPPYSSLQAGKQAAPPHLPLLLQNTVVPGR